MPRHIRLEPHLTDDELQDRYRRAADPVERSHWHFLWLLAGGMTATAVAAVTGYSAYWIGQIARRYNTDGPDGVRDRRHTTCAGRPDLPASQLAELRAAVAGPHPAGDRWCGRTVAAWLSERLGHQVGRQLGWQYLRRLGARWLKPRPRHVQADPHAQVEFKQHLRPLLRAVATAFPHASVELWAVDEHRIGLKPILQKVWTLPTFPIFPGQRPRRPIAPVEQRYDWRYLVGFVHPASGRTLFHLATSVSIPLFEVELAAFARQVGAGPDKQIVLVLDRAGWHASVHLRVPDHLVAKYALVNSSERGYAAGQPRCRGNLPGSSTDGTRAWAHGSLRSRPSSGPRWSSSCGAAISGGGCGSGWRWSKRPPWAMTWSGLRAGAGARSRP